MFDETKTTLAKHSTIFLPLLLQSPRIENQKLQNEQNKLSFFYSSRPLLSRFLLNSSYTDQLSAVAGDWYSTRARAPLKNVFSPFTLYTVATALGSPLTRESWCWVLRRVLQTSSGQVTNEATPPLNKKKE